MSGIFGIFNRNSKPLSPNTVQAMYEAMAYWGPDGGGTWYDGSVGLGQLLLYNTPEALFERLPQWIPEYKIAFTAEARIDNRKELCDLFNLPCSERPQIPGSELILRAYLKWDDKCVDHLLGDWSFAIWHPYRKQLFLARDHHGNTSIYYYADREMFAFASTKKALLTLPQIPQRLNEVTLAQSLFPWVNDGIETIHQDVYRLPPAHSLTIIPEKLDKHRYWYLEDTSKLNYKRQNDYVDGLHEVFTEAVRSQLRSYRPVGVTLSGGLDSGSVAVIAADLLAQQGKRLPAYTSVPMHDVRSYLPHGDEGPFAQATAAYNGNIDVSYLHSEHISPLTGIRWGLNNYDAPIKAPSNTFWLLDIMQTAQQQGVGTGRSTLLQAFLNRGYAMISDDITAIDKNADGQPMVLPGYPQVKLWTDVTEKLGQPTADLCRVRAQLDKFAVPTKDNFAKEPIPLHAIYLLIPYNYRELRLERLVNTGKFNVFISHTYCRRFLDGLGLRSAHFQLAVTAAQVAQVSQVYRPRHPFLLDELVNLIERDFCS